MCYTGDNGLGKSFLLDIVWYALTSQWPVEVNGRMTSGYMARPLEVAKESIIRYTVGGSSKKDNATIEARYEREYENWKKEHDDASKTSLVVYAHYDGSFSVWDPHRNHSSRSINPNANGRQSAFVLTQSEVWDGMNSISKSSGKEIPNCNGLVRDWVSWQDRHKDNVRDEFSILSDILENLSS